ncbi:MAG: glycosyl hydrolase [Paludibacter sp.]|nr:glycosyl hydrolase [Paludibacter sp.]
MKKSITFFLSLFYLCPFAQQAIQVGSGSYAEYPPESVWDEDGYFAKSYRWFHDNWDNLYLDEHAREKPLPTNKWWTNYVFSQYGGDAWAYPHAVSANNEGLNIEIPNGFQGGSMLTSDYLQIKGASTLQTEDEAVVFADFESEFYPEGWTVGQNPAFSGPVSLDEIDQSPTPNGFTGARFVNSFKGNEAKLSLTSPAFVINKKYIRLRVGGGNYIDDTYVGLYINGNRVLAETGENSGTLTQRTWDVSDYVGQTAEIRIVDNSIAGWGFIMCDEIVFSNSTFAGTGYPTDFAPLNSNVYDWTDLGFTFRTEDANGRYMNVDLVHGVPFTWIQLNNIIPIIKLTETATVYDENGNVISNFPVQIDDCAFEFAGRIYGIHLPAGSKIYKSKGEDFQIEIPASANKYIVVSDLPSVSLLKTYDKYARNRPVNTTYTWDYVPENGKITTTFNLSTKNLDTDATGGNTLMSFLPHHYRDTNKSFEFVAGADYRVVMGLMHTAVGNSFSIQYNFTGLPPYLPEPLNLSDQQKTRLSNLIQARADVSTGYNGNTYAKGLGEESNVMLMAKATDNPNFVTLKNNLKTELEDWLTYDPSEASAKQYFFAKYPNYGALIGFPPGYGSQGFNDLHFHYGYFATGAARLMMVDDEFKKDYADMVKLVVKSFCNWKHYPDGNDYLPFMRTFDPYFGHSFAGGTGDGGGNNQESTSEAVHSWFGIYQLGVVLNDPEIIKLGAMGYLLETTAANEYWMDMYDDNFPDTYDHEYAGIVRTDNVSWATYFSGDPGWVLGIQGVPCDFFYNSYLGKDPQKMKSIWKSMIKERTENTYDPDGDGPLGQTPFAENTDAFENILGMGSYLGGYHLNLMNTFDPQQAALFTDSLYAKGGEWSADVNMATEYYVANAILTYGAPDPEYHTSIASGAVYKNSQGEITYLLYNPTDKDVNVGVYKNNQLIETIKVGAGKYFNSRMIGVQKPTVTITSHKENDKLALNDHVVLSATANDKDDSVQSVEFFLGNKSVGVDYIAPYSVTCQPLIAGNTQIKAVATDNDGNKSDTAVVAIEVLSQEQTSYINRPWNIPTDKILAVEFDNGGAEIACHDNEINMLGGNNLRSGTGVETEDSNDGDGNIGYTNAEEWYEYTVNVETTAVYAFSLKISSAGGGALHLEFDGVDKTGQINLNATGSWGNYKDTTVAYVPLMEGEHVMRIFIDKTGMNLSSYKFAITDQNVSPTVDAGSDQVITLAQTVSLQGVARAYSGSSITEYEWTQIDSNSAVIFSNKNSLNTEISGLELGTYQFRLTVTDSHGLSATDDVVVLVKPANYPPVANPGTDRTISSDITELTFDASGSTDPDGTIVKYEWTQIDQNASLALQQSSSDSPILKVSGFLSGHFYILQLTVTDNLGLSSFTNVRIIVEDPSTGLNLSELNNWEVYPNPFDNQLRIKLPNDTFKILRVTSLTGSVCVERSLAGKNDVILNTSALSSGCYILTLISDQQVLSKKIIK